MEIMEVGTGWAGGVAAKRKMGRFSTPTRELSKNPLFHSSSRQDQVGVLADSGQQEQLRVEMQRAALP